MSIFNSFDISASGLTAQRFRMDIIAENVANANSTRTEDGSPYVRKVVTFEEKGETKSFSRIFHSALNNRKRGGVKVGGVYEDTWTQANMVYDPSHPDADENGYVTYPNVDTVTEMTNLIDASRSYEANATAFNASKSIATTGLDIAQNG
ncbi:MAG: flagellar basal body rod protein FlgC [Lachnospiraceae bacterium]|nr:flagellar basal body rod protein FlgC [Lachnospiraceae bacterium]